MRGEEGARPEVVAFGEPMAALYPADASGDTGESVLVSDYKLTWGGDTSNFCLAIAKLRHTCAYITRVGDDPFGRGFLALWRDRGVDTRGVQVDSSRRTGLYVATFRGRRHELVYYRQSSAATQVDRSQIDWGMIDRAKVLHVSGISQAISPAMRDLSFELMSRAKGHGVMVSYDVNYRPALWEAREARSVAIETIKRFVDILTVTDEEMRVLGLADQPERLAQALPRVPAWIGVKLGSEGSFMETGGDSFRVGSFKVTFRDSVGAGDAYDAALIVGILEGGGLPKVAQFANAVAALTCTGVGPLERQPSREEVERFLREETTIQIATIDEAQPSD